MTDTLYSQFYRKFFHTGIALASIILIGTIGYWLIGEKNYSLVDCLYMTVITIMTIGYGEIIDMSHNPAGRLFTIFVAVSGIGAATYILTNLTAFMVEGEMKEVFRRRRMEKMIKKLRGHYIVCGIGGVGLHIVSELYQTKRPHVAVDADKTKLEKLFEEFRDEIFVEGDATDNNTLLTAGIKEARGLFAVTGDDNQNLVLSLTAKQLNPGIRVVARCHDFKNREKMKAAGADAVVSPASIGGLRMASEMVRATVVSFLDTMLRDKEKNLRIEEVEVPGWFAGKAISAISLEEYPNTLLLAVKAEKDWLYNPRGDYLMEKGNVLIFMTTPRERDKLENIFRETE